VNTLVRNIASAFFSGAVIGATFQMASAASSDHRDFTGTVAHISVTNIKVTGTEGGKLQTLSFLIDPKVTKLTHNDGKSTAQLRDIHVGDMVDVRFDQKLLGIRHADAIIDHSDGMRLKS
jgi:hypothetical protein